MQQNPAAYEAGAAEARQDISASRLRMFSGAPDQGWGRDLAKTMNSRFGIEVIFTSCFVTEKLVSFEQGYNAAVAAHVDGIWGEGSLAQALAEVEARRKQQYDAWVAATKPAGPGTLPDAARDQ
jgi:hypothetical protein